MLFLIFKLRALRFLDKLRAVVSRAGSGRCQVVSDISSLLSHSALCIKGSPVRRQEASRYTELWSEMSRAATLAETVAVPCDVNNGLRQICKLARPVARSQASKPPMFPKLGYFFGTGEGVA